MINPYQDIEKYLNFEYQDDMKIGRTDNTGKQQTVVYFYKNENGEYQLGKRNKKIAEFYINDKTIIVYRNDPTTEKFGSKHNSYGPAEILSSPDGTILSETWYYDGKNLTLKVKEYLNDNNLNHHNMTDEQFDTMWEEIQ